jgi:hypothetical protein
MYMHRVPLALEVGAVCRRLKEGRRGSRAYSLTLATAVKFTVDHSQVTLFFTFKLALRKLARGTSRAGRGSPDFHERRKARIAPGRVPGVNQCRSRRDSDDNEAFGSKARKDRLSRITRNEERSRIRGSRRPIVVVTFLPCSRHKGEFSPLLFPASAGIYSTPFATLSRYDEGIDTGKDDD